MSAELLHLDNVSAQCGAMTSRTEELGRYITDLSQLYNTLHNNTVGVQCEVYHGYLHVTLSNIPPSHLSTFVKIDISPYQPALLHHAHDSHVVSTKSRDLVTSSDLTVTLELPDIAELTLVHVGVSLVCQCPPHIEHRISEDKRLFSLPLYSKTISALSSRHCMSGDKPRDHVITRDMPPHLEQYHSSNKHTFNLTVQCTADLLPSDLPGEVKRSDISLRDTSRDVSLDTSRIASCDEEKSEFQICGISREELISVIVKLRNSGLLFDKQSEGVSLASSLEKLLDAYDNVRNIKVVS